MFGHVPLFTVAQWSVAKLARRLFLLFLVVLASNAITHAVSAVEHEGSEPNALAEAWAADDAATLRRAATRLVSNRLASTFDAIEARVPVYGDWVYGWLSSIWISFDVLVVGAREAGTQLYQDETLDIPTIRHRIEDYVTDQFERQVISPEQTERRMIAAWTTTVERVKDLDRRLAENRGERVRALADERGVDPEPILRAHAQPLLAAWSPERPPDLRIAPTAALLDPPSRPPQQAELVLTRSLRPLATRVLSVGARFTIVPLVGGAVLIPGVDPTGFTGATAMAGIIIAGLWGADYAVNWLDSALNRSQFEAGLKAAIAAARSRTVLEAQGHIARSFCTDQAVLPGC